MKSMGEKHHLLLVSIYNGLKTCLIILGGIIIGGTIYGVFSNTGLKNQPNTINSFSVEEGQTFTGIGRIRISTADQNPQMVILFVSFMYYPGDRAFSEELALRVKEFRQIITDYFGSFSSSDLQMVSEEYLKTELLHRFNNILRLGQIETLFFSDYLIIN